MNTTQKTFADKWALYIQSLQSPADLPADVHVMNPYKVKEAFKLACAFYRKYYEDVHERIICFGINPGRFGAGITGIPFTDPIRLETVCGISNPFDKRAELSSQFIYEMIEAYGGASAFYRHFYLSAVSPLGYVKEGINLNYYDIKNYKSRFEKYVASEIDKQFSLGIANRVAVSIGKGQNAAYLQDLNKKYRWFDEVISLPHPRWIMQYRSKQKTAFIGEYLNIFSKLV